ncbi:hypothetical protein LTR64_000655 [Lithohypha guttulata]|uniref:uncharacterized protein n=1 Tax=Lithohypha guttulata TaxID=1690604 RepID=UPI002DE1625C|nr:hypothetical protein LTR51_005576 [Lithohypha guttulata]
MNSARNLVDEIASIGALDRQRSNGQDGEGMDDRMDFDSKHQHLQGGAIPVSAPNHLSGSALKLVVVNRAARDDLANRLNEAKNCFLDLCERQLSDLLDAAPSGSQTDIEDVDKLLVEMRAVRRCMETMVAIEKALAES